MVIELHNIQALVPKYPTNFLVRECFSLLVYNNTPCDADGC